MTDEKNIYEFTMHVNKPNNEDVEPLLYREWAAVADGMGGSGSQRHSVKWKLRSDSFRILEYVLPEWKRKDRKEDYADFLPYLIAPQQGASTYIDRIFEPCVSNEVNTSARWASRIVMTRFLFYISTRKVDLNDEASRNKLLDFLLLGLQSVKRSLKLSVGDSLETLPTTFVTSRYQQIEDGEYIVDVAWAGDSRCYILDGYGLRKLSKDDENEGGLLTNVLSADTDGELHFSRYKFKPPFAIICASDGFFDAYDKFGLTVEAKLLEDVQAANSSDELRARLIDRYELSLADDTSLTFVPIGFDTYAEFKELLLERSKQIAELFDKHQKFFKIVEVTKLPERKATVSIVDRFESKFKEIIKILTSTYLNGEEDLMLSEWWKQEIALVKEHTDRKFVEQAQQRKKQLRADVLEAIKIRAIENCLNLRIAGDDEVAKAVNAYVRKRSDYDGAVKAQNAKKREMEAMVIERRRLAQTISNEMKSVLEEASKSVDSFVADCDLQQNEEETEKRRSLSKQFIALTNIESALRSKKIALLTEKNGKQKKGGFYDHYAPLISDVLQLINRRLQINGAKESNVDQIKTLEKDLETVFGIITKRIDVIVEQRNRFLNPAFIDELNMNSIEAGEIGNETLLAEVINEMIAKYQRDYALIEKTLNEYKLIVDGVSCIDGVFSASSLSKFRDYYRYSELAKSDDVMIYRQELDEYEKAIDFLLNFDSGAEFINQSVDNELEEVNKSKEIADNSGNDIQELALEEIADTSDENPEEKAIDADVLSEAENVEANESMAEKSDACTEREALDAEVIDKIKARNGGEPIDGSCE